MEATYKATDKFYSHADHLVHVISPETNEAPCGARVKSMTPTVTVLTRWCRVCWEARQQIIKSCDAASQRAEAFNARVQAEKDQLRRARAIGLII